MEIIKKFRLSMCCIGVSLFGTCWGYAEYPEPCILNRHLRGQGGNGDTIPNAYRQLSGLLKTFETKRKAGLLREEEEKGRLRFFWEKEQRIWNSEWGDLTGVTVDVSSISESEYNFPSGVIPLMAFGRDLYGKKLSDFDFGKYMEADEKAKEVCSRYLRVILSDRFLNRALGENYVSELFQRCKAGAKVLLYYELQRETKGRISVMMSIMDCDRGYFDIHDGYKTGKTKFEVHLKLTWDAIADEIEKVELCDKFIVNKPIGCYKKGWVLFEKNR